MKRDMELVRQILLTVENHEHGYAPERIEVPNYTEEVIGYHLLLMGEAGLLRVHQSSVFEDASPMAVVERMTWWGHEFIGNARNETIWAKVKAIVVAKGGSVSFEVLRFLVTETAKSYFLPEAAPPLPPQP